MKNSGSTLFSISIILSIVSVIAVSSLRCTNVEIKKGSGKNLLLPEFVKIPAGHFLMGADLDPKYIVAGKEEGWRSIFIQDEFPVRRITITRPFEISKYETTNAQYEQFDPSHKSWRGNFMDISTEEDEPVVYASWEEAVKYTRWLSEKDPDYEYRLPTEAEWEYVARAGTLTPYSSGESGDIYDLTPFDSVQIKKMNYQWPYPFTYSNGCRSWVGWVPGKCTGVEDVYPANNKIEHVDLVKGGFGPNNFGVYDMHGGVEEWVLDWYGIYNINDTIDPAGYKTGDFKVTRGGSHNNHIQHTRSANRMSSAVNDKHYLLGFRVVRVPKNQKIKDAVFDQPLRPWGENISGQKYNWDEDKSVPHFSITSLYELIPMKKDGSHYGNKEQMRQFGFNNEKQVPLLTGPHYTHNHSPTICWTENGDILVSWFSGECEIGPELTLLASRGKRQNDGSLKWTQPSEFLKAADRNMHSSNLLNNTVRLDSKLDDNFTLHQMASIGVAGRWDKLALGYRKSVDNGATWSPVKMILELDHGLNNGVCMQGNMLQTSNGELMFVAEDKHDSVSSTGSLVVSTDNGKSWQRRGYSSVTPDSQRIAGLHAAVVEIDDINNDNRNDLMAIARDYGKYYSGKAPLSISTDGGHTWKRKPSMFPSVRTGQRVSLLKLRYSNETTDDGRKSPILFTGFANDSILTRDGEGKLNYITGLFAAVSFDGGKTWPEKFRKVISNLKGKESKDIEIAPWQRANTLTKTNGQEEGYLSVTQSPDGIIYLTDGKIVYSFNLAWLVH
jgi:formylglycine-generating enzyme required for sulfatase activity